MNILRFVCLLAVSLSCEIAHSAAPRIVYDRSDAWRTTFQWTIDDKPVLRPIHYSERYFQAGYPVSGDKKTGIADGVFDNSYVLVNHDESELAFWTEEEDITDFTQSLYAKGAKDPLNTVKGAVPKANSPWHLEPLNAYLEPSMRIPDLYFLGDRYGETVYEFVDLDLYARNNPFGPLAGAWSMGDTLDDLNLNIVNGVIPGIQGLYFATTPFLFQTDPSMPAFLPSGGDAAWLNSSGSSMVFGGEHYTGAVPEAGTYGELGALLLGLVIYIRRLNRIGGMRKSEQ